MRNVLDNWEEERVLFSKPIFFITDYDGTLTPIVETPEEADLSDDMRARLEKLKEKCPVGIVSGRSLENLRSKIDIDGIYYSGNHGYEISGPGIDFLKEEAKEARTAIEDVCSSLRKETDSIEGVLVEDKKFTASIHYRMVEDDQVRKLKNIIQGRVKPYIEKGVLESSSGKKVFEIRPKLNWDKGKAVDLLRSQVGFEDKDLTLYLGDDVTDENVFSSFGETGIGILVSNEEKKSEADYRLKDVEEVGKFIEKLTGMLEEKD